MPRSPAVSPLLSFAVIVPDELDLSTKHALALAAGGREAEIAAFRCLASQLIGPKPGERVN